ncbi:MAG TPA: hypothetical protein VEE85_00260 [Candidatus Bathyarchaeia archaeon]|nr:hypothetical protein [Candidatus Bathyarchaeia archaeon]
MKRTMSLLVILTLSAALVPSAYAASGCSNATMKGNYIFDFKGWYPFVNAQGNLNLSRSAMVNYVGIGTFDGAGNFSTTFTACYNGTCAGNQTNSGTYSINPDCSGSMPLQAGSWLHRDRWP